jgi:polyisoprenoid-binding protein YceI
MHRYSFVFASALVLVSCTSQIDDKPAASVKDAKAGDTKAAAGKAVAIDPAASSIGFVGAKLSDDHEGKFADFSGDATLDGDTLTALALTVKTTSIDVEPQKLEDHLRSADFFDVEKHPTATFKSTSIQPKADGENTHVIEGTLDLRGVTKTVSFPAKVAVEKGKATGKAEFTINRKDFGIVYAGMPDDIIKDEVLMKIDLSIPRA